MSLKIPSINLDAVWAVDVHLFIGWFAGLISLVCTSSHMVISEMKIYGALL